MADPDVTWGALGATAFTALTTGIGWLVKSAFSGKDETIAVLKADLLAKEATIKSLGDKCDARQTRIDELQERFAGHVIRTGDWEQIPTGVHRIASNVGGPSVPPRELPEATKTLVREYVEKG